MQEGFIDNVKVPVYWKEKGFKNSLLPYRKKKQGVRIMLGTGDDWYGGSVSAFLCYKCSIVLITTLIISKKPGNTGISRDIRTEFTTDLLLSD